MPRHWIIIGVTISIKNKPHTHTRTGTMFNGQPNPESTNTQINGRSQQKVDSLLSTLVDSRSLASVREGYMCLPDVFIGVHR